LFKAETLRTSDMMTNHHLSLAACIKLLVKSTKNYSLAAALPRGHSSAHL